MTDFACPDGQKSLTLSEGLTYSYVYIEAQAGKATILLLHGFPETSYDWHHQVTYFRSRGYGIIAPDLLGYGQTDKPQDKHAYRLKSICEQVLSIVSQEGVEKVIGVGHDFGSMLLSRMSSYYPERFLGYAFVSTGYTGPQGRFDAAAMNAMIEPVLGYPAFGYFMFFDEADAVQLLERDAESTESLLFGDKPGHWARHICPPGAARAWLEAGRIEALPEWLDEATIQTRRSIFRRGGYLGPLNWYRQAQSDVNNADEESLPSERRGIAAQPVLLVTETGKESAVPGEFQKKMTSDACHNLRMVEIESNHWAMLHAPVAVNHALEGFFEEVMKMGS